MIDVISLVNFDNPNRVAYLERSFGSFHKFNKGHRHLVFDSSKFLERQKPFYDKYGVEFFHDPGLPYGARLHKALSKVKTDHFVFLPDDYEWIFPYPLERAAEECRRHGIAELKLAARGMTWYGTPGAQPQPWHTGGKVISGEQLNEEGDLFVSRRRWIRDFHEQFSLACNMFNTDFAQWIYPRIPPKVVSPSAAEKQAYVRLLFHRYAVAYYKMWIPAFHFIDLSVEGSTEKNRYKVETSLVPANFETYNRNYNV